MQVDPMSRFSNKKMSNQAKVITLEGKTRLPARLQEAVIDVGTIVNHATSHSANGEAFQLPQLAKNFTVLETTVNNTTSTLKKLEKLLDKGVDSNNIIEQNLPFIKTTVDTLGMVDSVHSKLQEMKI